MSASLPLRILIPLFSPATGTWGGLTRALAIASAARQVGYDVAFCASGYVEKSLREHGFQVYSTPSPTLLGLPAPISRLMESRSQNVSLPFKPGKSIGNIWFVWMFSGMARAGFLRQLVKAELAAVQDFKADGLVTDLDLATYLTSEISGLPIATAYQQIMSEGRGSFAWNMIRRATSGILRTYARPVIPPEELAFGPRGFKIIPSIPELDGADPNRADICYVGNLLGPIKAGSQDDFQPEAGKRYLFVYVGTGSIAQSVLRDVLPLLLSNNDTLKVIVGGVNISKPEYLGGVEFHPYISAEALLPHCDWTICHGGQNTIIQSLIYGVPLLVFPGPIFERRFNARKVQEAGAGRMGELTDFNVEWLRQGMAQWNEYAAHAQILGKRIELLGGAAHAVQAIGEAFAKRGKVGR